MKLFREWLLNELHQFPLEEWPVALDYFGEKGDVKGVAEWLRPFYRELASTMRQSTYLAEDPEEMAQVRQHNEQWARTLEERAAQLEMDIRHPQTHLQMLQALYHEPHDPALIAHLRPLMQIWQQFERRIEFQ